MKNLFFVLALLLLNQDFDVNEFLNGKWCEGKNKECFYLKHVDGLMIFEIPDGGYKSGVEVVKYDKKQNKIYWRIIGTTKPTQYFKILKGKKYIEYFDGNRTKKIRKFLK